MKTNPVILRDFSRGRLTKKSANNALLPLNSVAHSFNVNFDTTLGSAVVRPGTTLLGSTVASNKTPLGLTEFVTSGGALNYLISAFSGASNTTLYYFNGSSWTASGLTTLSNTATNRFTQLGNRVFQVNGTDAMKSSADGATWSTTNCITTNSVIPSLVFAVKGRILAAGYSGFRDRVYFSSVIDPNASPTLTWSTDPATGDFIDINPDDGSNVTGFAMVSNVTLVFKGNGLYRLDTVNKTVDTQSIYDVGAVSQEGIVTARGMTYFFAGTEIARTDGGYPTRISRLGVQDFVDAIPQANWSSVSAGTDGINVYFSIGTITLNTNTDKQRTYINVVLKFSIQDETWSAHYYAQLPKFFCRYTNTTNGRQMIMSDTSGSVQTVNVGTTDNGTPIYYELETQNVEMENRSHQKQISTQLSIFTNYGQDSKFQIRINDGDFQDVQVDLRDRVNIAKIIKSFTGNFFTFRWFGDSSGTPPVFEGIQIEDITDLGMVSQ